MSKLSMNSMVAWSALHLTKCHLSTHKLAVICMATARTLSQDQVWVPTPPKNNGKAPSILNADDEDHVRIRKA